MAEEMGMKEGEDFWLIYDNFHTELLPEAYRPVYMLLFL